MSPVNRDVAPFFHTRARSPPNQTGDTPDRRADPPPESTGGAPGPPPFSIHTRITRTLA